jgi:hypothetical protein
MSKSEMMSLRSSGHHSFICGSPFRARTSYVPGRVEGVNLLLLGGYCIAGDFDGLLELLGTDAALVVGDLDGAVIEVRIGALDPGEPVQFAFDSGLAVAAAHVRYYESSLLHLSPL